MAPGTRCYPKIPVNPSLCRMEKPQKWAQHSAPALYSISLFSPPLVFSAHQGITSSPAPSSILPLLCGEGDVVISIAFLLHSLCFSIACGNVCKWAPHTHTCRTEGAAFCSLAEEEQKEQEEEEKEHLQHILNVGLKEKQQPLEVIRWQKQPASRGSRGCQFEEENPPFAH